MLVTFLIRIFISALVLLAVYGVYKVVIEKRISPPKLKNACRKCEGKGYWQGTRGREWCNACRGTGIAE